MKLHFLQNYAIISSARKRYFLAYRMGIQALLSPKPTNDTEHASVTFLPATD